MRRKKSRKGGKQRNFEEPGLTAVTSKTSEEIQTPLPEETSAALPPMTESDAEASGSGEPEVGPSEEESTPDLEPTPGTASPAGLAWLSCWVRVFLLRWRKVANSLVAWLSRLSHRIRAAGATQAEAPLPPEPAEVPTPGPPPEEAPLEPPPAQQSAVAAPPSPAALSPEPPGGSPEATTTSRVDQVLAVLTLERVLPELDAAKREVEEVKATSGLRVRQLEAEHAQMLAEVKKARAERLELESRAGTLRQALDVLERQLQEARQTGDERIRQLETERGRRRAEAERALADQHDLGLRIRQLEAMLDVSQGGHSPEEWAALESRVGTLEKELADAEQRRREEREAAEEDMRQREAEREQLAARLARTDEEIRLLRNSTASQLRPPQSPEMVAAGKPQTGAEEKETAEMPLQEPVPVQESAEAPAIPDQAALTEFHQSTMSRLTVILAAADLLSLNSRLEVSLRETAREIRNQGQLLAELIRKHTLPGGNKEGQ